MNEHSHRDHRDHRGTLKRAALLCALCALCGSASGAHVEVWLENFVSQGLTNRKVMVQPLSAPLTSGTNLVAGDRISFNATNSLTVSNMVAGLYRWQILGYPDTTTFYTLVPETNVLLNAVDLLVNQTGTNAAGSTSWARPSPA